VAKEIVLHAVKRELKGKKVQTLRNQGKLPAVIYGSGIESTPITLNLLDTTRTLRGVTASTLVNIELDGEEHTTLVRERQFDRIKKEMIHIDFQAVSMTELLKTRVPIQLVGVAPAVATFSAMVLSMVEELEVEALPRDLPESIRVDISVLKKIGDNISVADLDLGEKVEILTSLETVIVSAIVGVSAEEEEVAGEAEVEEGTEPEVIEKGKKEEEEDEE
jgi:large subunit ribosomal protein L25